MSHLASKVARGVSILTFVVLLTTAAFGAPIEAGGKLPREKENPITRIVRLIGRTVRSLGDAIVSPRP